MTLRFGLASHFVEKAAINGIFQLTIDLLSEIVFKPLGQFGQWLSGKLPDCRFDFLNFRMIFLTLMFGGRVNLFADCVKSAIQNVNFDLRIPLVRQELLDPGDKFSSLDGRQLSDGDF